MTPVALRTRGVCATTSASAPGPDVAQHVLSQTRRLTLEGALGRALGVSRPSVQGPVLQAALPGRVLGDPVGVTG